MQHKKETRPSRQARGRASRNKAMVAHNEETLGQIAIGALTLFAILVLPRLMYMVIAPTKGWI